MIFIPFQSLYESIKTEPFKIPEDDGNDLMHTFFNPDKEGWLWKQGGRYVDSMNPIILIWHKCQSSIDAFMSTRFLNKRVLQVGVAR